MKIDELQQKWAEMNSRLNGMEEGLSRQKFDGMCTAQDKLVRQYRMFAIIGGTFAILSLGAWSRLMGVGVGAMFAAFFLIAMVMDIVLMRKVRGIDIAGMPVGEVARRALACRRLHHICQIVLIPLAILAVGVLCHTWWTDTYLLIGCACGAALGLCLGLRAYRSIMRDYRKLMR